MLALLVSIPDGDSFLREDNTNGVFFGFALGFQSPMGIVSSAKSQAREDKARCYFSFNPRWG